MRLIRLELPLGGRMDIEGAFKLLPVLKKRKNPTVALVVGFLFGAIGLGIYFRRVIDFFAPWFAYIALAIFYSQMQGQGSLYVLFGAVFAAAYGYLRAMYSNAELMRQQSGSSLAPSPQSSPGASSAALATVPCIGCQAPFESAAASCPRCGSAQVPAHGTPKSAVQKDPKWWDATAGQPTTASSWQQSASPEKPWWQ
jgi:hypothetical protein